MQLVASRFQGLFQWSACSKTSAIQMVMEQLWLKLKIQNFHWICFLLCPRLLIHLKRQLLLSETDNGFLICYLLLSLGGSSVQSDILSMTGKAFPFMKWSLGNTSSLGLCNTRSQTMPLNLGFLQGFGWSAVIHKKVGYLKIFHYHTFKNNYIAAGEHAWMSNHPCWKQTKLKLREEKMQIKIIIYNV